MVNTTPSGHLFILLPQTRVCAKVVTMTIVIDLTAQLHIRSIMALLQK